MKISKAWLQADFAIAAEAQELSKRLTMAGLEVDGLLPAAAEFSGVVVGEVLDLVAHPDADKLRVATVNAGGEPLQIVCGAPNVAKGVKVPVALIGAQLPGLVIKKSKLRGVESFGMLCSARELGMSEDHSGLLILPADAPVGEDLRRYLSLEDVIIDVDLTPNRADCFSMRGVAREAAMLLGQDLPADFAAEQLGVVPVAVESGETVVIGNQAPQSCPQYFARVIEGVDNTRPTPLWLQERLRRAGLRTHDPLVDVTNYVMLLLGTPLHAFDAAKISGGIVIRQAQAGEKLMLINGNEAVLDEKVLLIADAEKPLAIAGVMGGLDSACSPNTQKIVLEAAWFEPVGIAGKARQFALSSDSAQRFERGVDYALQRAAMELTSRLIIEICGGQAGEVAMDVHPQYLPQRQPITLREKAIARRIGRSYETATVEKIFTALGCQIAQAAEGWLITPPTWRFDLAIEADLIEEIARVDGYDDVPNRLPQVDYQKDRQPPRPDTHVSTQLLSLGFQEAITYSFIDRASHAAFFADAPTVNLFNPISAEMAEMRLSLLPGLLNTAVYNRNRQQNELRLFELGNVFHPRGDKAVECAQIYRVAGVMSGLVRPEQWGEKARAVDFFDVKGVVEQLLGDLPVQYQRSQAAYLHPGQSADIYLAGQLIGQVGILHPQMLKTLGTKGGDFAVFELDMQALPTQYTPQFRAISKYPALRRDLALVLDKTVDAADILDCLRKEAAGLLQEAFVFDVFTGGNLAENKKSLALGLILQDQEKTLQDEEVEGIITRLVQAVNRTYGAELR